MSDELELRFARLVEQHVLHDAQPEIREIAADRPDLVAPLMALFRDYEAASSQLDAGVSARGAGGAADAPTAMVGGTPDRVPAAAPPNLDGFQVIDRLGAGGMGEVYKLRDLKLNRFVAAKVVRADGRTRAQLAEFLKEARSLALFTDPRVVQIFQFRDDVDPPVIIMEHVEGFELGRLGPSLEFPQRARILRDVCDAIHHAHTLGIQHRDLKPSNIMLDGSLTPKILDFGLSAGDPFSGHFRGTLHYLAPEQLDASQRIDARTDVYALGVILYALLTGVVPYGGDSTQAVLGAIQRAEPPLPVELDPRVPEPLQAIALKAMERQPADRYQSAREMARDLDRYLTHRPVLARPGQYASTLGTRVKPHVEAVNEWQQLKLIYPHEADRLRTAYRQLDAREDDWIAASRTLSYSQIALYFGAFVLCAGSLFYFYAHRFAHAVAGVGGPALVLAVPFLALNAAGRHLYRTERKAVAVAFFLAGVTLLPLFLLIWLPEMKIAVVPEGTPGQLFTDGSVSNHQMQFTLAVACAWCGWLALQTKTTALSTVFTVLGVLFTLAVLADFGLRGWFEDGHFDLLALHLWPLALAYGGMAVALDRVGRTWFARPLYIGATVVVVAVLDLLALDGKLFHYLGGVSLQSIQPKDVSDKVLIDTLGALSLNGIAFYLLASSIDKYGRDLMKLPAALLFVIAPFSTLEPLAYLVDTHNYQPFFDWLYLGLAVGTAWASHYRQRKNFYYAGLINTGFALFFIADHKQWFDRPGWAITLVVIGLIALAAGFGFDARERRREG